MPATPKFVPTPDLAGDFESDMRNAQDLYDTYVRSGYSEQDADQMFIAPVRAKWEMINKSPLLAQNPTKRKEFGAQFSAAQDVFRKNLGQYSRDTGQLAAERAFTPLFNRWSVESQIPQPPVIPLMTPADRDRITDLRQKINRLESERRNYKDKWIELQHPKDPNDKAEVARNASLSADYQKQVEDLAGQLGGLQSEYGGLLQKYGQPQVDSVPSMPVQASPAFQPPTTTVTAAPQQPTGEFSAADWLNQPPPDMGQQINRIFQPVPAVGAQPIEAQAETTPRKPVIFISGRPDLSNVTREQADASWQARFGPPMSSRTSFTPPVQETLPDVEGLEPSRTIRINSQSEYDALPSGTQYYDSAGRLARKR